jgi:hypothetical protein
MHLEKDYYCGDEETAKRARLWMGLDPGKEGFKAISNGEEVIGDALVLEVMADELRLVDDPEDLAKSCVDGGLEPGAHRLNTPTAFVATRIGEKALTLKRIEGGQYEEFGGAVQAVRQFDDDSIYN